MIFVGYQGISNNCRQFDPKTRKITVAASVRFDGEKIYYTSQKTVGAEEEMRLFVRLDDENSEDALDQEAEAKKELILTKKKNLKKKKRLLIIKMKRQEYYVIVQKSENLKDLAIRK
ncbi:copia-like protein [Lasius niger]|uniref:Copia-like protein n=1 Tax=Lasius niger TaxID=67767 RepID=A0A0J7JV44_LASNI|nr:copia-like protein [Lasius niger]